MDKYGRQYGLVTALILFFSGVAFGSPSNSVSIPNSFSPNTTIQSSQVNSNFSEVQSKYNNHSHTDITQVGTITTGGWAATPIETQYGGTGQDFSASTQGSILYWNALGTTATLPPSTAGYVLSTNGVGANPSWIASSGGAKDGISRGFELVCEQPNAARLIVNAGTLYHNTVQIDKTTGTILTFATAGDWSSGSTVTYAGGAGFCYVGVDSLGNVKLLGNGFPGSSDSSGNKQGTSLYYYDGTKYWRVVGGTQINTSNVIPNTFINYGNEYQYDDFISKAGLNQTSFSDLDLSGEVQRGSYVIMFGIDLNSANSFSVRRNGSSATNGVIWQPGSAQYGPTWVAVNPSNSTVQYKVNAGNSILWLYGYKVNYR